MSEKQQQQGEKIGQMVEDVLQQVERGQCPALGTAYGDVLLLAVIYSQNKEIIHQLKRIADAVDAKEER